MELAEFVDSVGNFDELPPKEKVRALVWHLHAHESLLDVTTADVRRCFDALHMTPPDLSIYMKRMSESRPPELIKSRKGYRLERQTRKKLDEQHASEPSRRAVSRVLSDLPAALGNNSESIFLDEALRCYQVKAYRAAIVMAWNLAFDHLLQWMLRDTQRLSAFNAAIIKRYPKSNVQIVCHDDFSQLKEFEFIEVCSTANLMPKNVIEILRDKLKRRNAAAHPSSVTILEPQAADTITDLVNNVVLRLK